MIYYHKTYISKIADLEVFEVNKFVDILHYKEYWEDSFTKYSNKIGLTVGGKYIDDSSDMVLDFPYKDCVLKVGIIKEDVEHSVDLDAPISIRYLSNLKLMNFFNPKFLLMLLSMIKAVKIL